MKKYVVLAKHSLPEIIKGPPDSRWNLSKEGQVRADRLADRLRRYEPEVIVSSKEAKARETVWNELGLPSFVVVDLGLNTLVTKENII